MKKNKREIRLFVTLKLNQIEQTYYDKRIFFSSNFLFNLMSLILTIANKTKKIREIA